jgi:hypothetical protein
MSRDSQHCPVKSTTETPMVKGQPRGISTRGAEPLLTNPRVLKRRSIGFTPPVLHWIFGAEAAMSASGFRGSRTHDSKVSTAGIPKCQSPDTLDLRHLSTLRSTVPTKSGNRTSRFQRAWDYCTRPPRFADM